MFDVGAEYRIKTSFQAMRDVFVEGERLVYTSSAWSRYDGITGCFFHDLANGARRVWDVGDDEDAAPLVGQYFECVDDGWPQPARFRVEPPVLGHPAVGLHSPEMAALVPYTKDLVEGCDGLQNWFVWFMAHGEVWRLVLTRAEFLRYKFAPVGESRRILDALGIVYEYSPRYAWLDERGG
jgi:hypothetical protein